MQVDLNKAEQTAVDAAKAMIKVFDFAASVLEELSKAVAEATDLKLGQYDAVRLSTQDARVIRRYTKSRSYGEARVQRYLYSLFSIPPDLFKTPEDQHPFLLVSLVNVESRPPSLIYGIVKKIEGNEKTDKDFVDFFLLWLNEELNAICQQAERREYGWELEHQLSGRADANKLRARVSFQAMRLFDISSEEQLSERATAVAKWFTDLLSK